MKKGSIYKTYTIFLIVTLLLIGTVSWAGEGAIVVFDNPSYPYSFLIWGDDYGSDLTVAMALRKPTGEPTLDDALEIFLPETARHFTPLPFIPDSYNVKGGDVPVTVYEEEELVVYNAYSAGNQDSLEPSRVASGWVKGHWSGKSFKVISYSAIGPVDLKGGGEAQLVAVGHEYYKDGAFSEPDTNEKVDLH